MDRWVRSELRTFPGGIAGARVGEASSHLVNGVAEHQKISTRLKSITIHLASPTTIACKTQERTKEREKRVNVDRGWYALCSWGGRLTREGKTCFEPSRGFFPADIKPYPEWSLTSRITVVVIIVFQAKVQSYAIDVRILRRISTLYYEQLILHTLQWTKFWILFVPRTNSNLLSENFTPMSRG